MNILLTDYEMKLVTDPLILLTKNKIIEKVYDVFGDVLEEYKSVFNSERVFAADETDAKISRGENYRGLPYVILDYPRRFSKVDVFAVRTLFWWGNFYSITLQLSGIYQYNYSRTLEKAIDDRMLEGWFIGRSQTAWEHHFENDNYLPVQQAKYNLSDYPHIKIAKKIPLAQWDEVELFLKENFTFLMKVLAS